MSRGRGASRRGFTLLETILAVGILSAVVIVCMQMRVQAMGRTREIASAQRADRDVEALFQQFINGLLADPVADPETGLEVWIGTHLGEPYRIERVPVVLENPITPQVQAETAPRILMARYTIRVRGRETEFLWHR